MQNNVSKIKNEKWLSIPDVIIIAVVIVFAVLLLVFCNFSTADNAKYNIYVENQLYKTGSLCDDCEIEVETQNGTSILVVANGKIHMEHGNCPDEFCEKQGEISSSQSKIICLPNKIVVEIVGGEKTNIDAVS